MQQRPKATNRPFLPCPVADYMYAVVLDEAYAIFEHYLELFVRHVMVRLLRPVAAAAWSHAMSAAGERIPWRCPRH